MHQVDFKDGYSVGDCQNDWQRRLLEFLVPIVHPEKPTWVTITIGNTLFGTLDRGREVDWGVVFWDMAQRLAKGVGKPKPTPICPFLFHLYDGQGLLTADEEVDYWTAKEMARSGFAAPNGRRRACPSAITSTGTLADAQPVEEIDIQGAIRISSSPVQGTIKPGSTGNTAEDAATGFSTGR